MKIRNGFVSNSSSSSFCIMGVNLGYDYISKMKKEASKDLFNNKTFVEKMQKRVKCGEHNDKLPTDFEIKTLEDLQTAMDDVGIPTCLDERTFGFDFISEFDESEDDYGAGLDIRCQEGDETKNQFIHRVYELVSKFFDIKEEDVNLYQWSTYG